MRAAPAVEARLGSGRVERCVITMLHGVTAAVVWCWWRASGLAEASSPTSWSVVLAAGPAACAGWAMARHLLPSTAALRWTGSRWQLDGGVELQQLDVQMDAGAWLLLRARASAGERWLVATQARAGAQWHGLRVALQAHAGRTPVAAEVRR